MPISDRRAAYLLRWTRRLAALVVFGYAAAEIGLLFGLYRVAYEALLKLVSLAVLVCLVIIVLQIRAPVAARIRAADGRTGAAGAAAQPHRRGVARGRHLLPGGALAGLGLRGAERLLAPAAGGGVRPSSIVVLARLLAIAAYGALDRALHVSPETAARHPGLEARARGYQPLGHALL